MRIVALMLVTMVIAALAVDGLFSALGLIPTGPRPDNSEVFSSIELNYKLMLNVVGAAIFGALVWVIARRGVTDPVCGMAVDRDKAEKLELDGRTHFFCSPHCLQASQADPRRYLDGGDSAASHHGDHPDHARHA